MLWTALRESAFSKTGRKNNAHIRPPTRAYRVGTIWPPCTIGGLDTSHTMGRWGFYSILLQDEEWSTNRPTQLLQKETP